MYRVNGKSPFSLPVDGWSKIRRAQQLGMADDLRIDVCDRTYLAEPARPIPDEVLIESLRGLIQAAPVVDSMAASEAIAHWCGVDADKSVQPPTFDAGNLDSLCITADARDQGMLALVLFWTIMGAYDALSSPVQEEVRASANGQLSLTDDFAARPRVPVDLPNWILSRHVRVVEDSLEDAYFARCRLYLACLDWYRQKQIPPKPMDSVAIAVTCQTSTPSAIEA